MVVITAVVVVVVVVVIKVVLAVVIMIVIKSQVQSDDIYMSLQFHLCTSTACDTHLEHLECVSCCCTAGSSLPLSVYAACVCIPTAGVHSRCGQPAPLDHNDADGGHTHQFCWFFSVTLQSISSSRSMSGNTTMLGAFHAAAQLV